jgi:hypothetical protein
VGMKRNSLPGGGRNLRELERKYDAHQTTVPNAKFRQAHNGGDLKLVGVLRRFWVLSAAGRSQLRHYALYDRVGDALR